MSKRLNELNDQDINDMNDRMLDSDTNGIRQFGESVDILSDMPPVILEQTLRLLTVDDLCERRQGEGERVGNAINKILKDKLTRFFSDTLYENQAINYLTNVDGFLESFNKRELINIINGFSEGGAGFESYMFDDIGEGKVHELMKGDISSGLLCEILGNVIEDHGEDDELL